MTPSLLLLLACGADPADAESTGVDEAPVADGLPADVLVADELADRRAVDQPALPPPTWTAWADLSAFRDPLAVQARIDAHADALGTACPTTAPARVDIGATVSTWRVDRASATGTAELRDCVREQVLTWDLPQEDPARLALSLTANTPGYRVHEWGLVRFGATADLSATSGTPGTPAPVVPGFLEPVADKPVVRLHAEEGWPADREIQVEVGTTGGILREVWPTPEAGPQPAHTDRWTFTVRVLDTSCGTGTLPAADAPACAGLDLCEAAALAAVTPPADRCLDVSGVQTTDLVYAGSSPAAPTLRLAGDRVHNDGEHLVGPVWVRRDQGVVRVDRLEPGESAVLADASPEPDVAAALGLDAVSRGLTLAEAQAFTASWRDEVLTDPVPWTALWLPSPADVDALLPLRLDPAPERVVRVVPFALVPPPPAPEPSAEVH